MRTITAGVVALLGTWAVAAEPVPVAPLVLPASPRVLVFAPHPDDETLATGGLLARLAGAGHPVRVVFFTNGDGYAQVVSGPAGRPATDADFRAYGARRQAEAHAALARLGVPPGSVRFLGFPDGGLAELWRAHWASPYTSPFTREERPPYHGVVDPHAEYEGRDLTALVAAQLRDFRPTVVFLPHPADTHLDHAHAGRFAIEAIASLEAAGALPSRLATFGYLVHYPDWPLRHPPAWDRVLPAPALAAGAWVEARLSPADLAAKRAAIARYRTQLRVMPDFLHAFLTRNELYTRLDPELVARIAAVH